jgi:hypothetical protein
MVIIMCMYILMIDKHSQQCPRMRGRKDAIAGSKIHNGRINHVEEVGKATRWVGVTEGRALCYCERLYGGVTQKLIGIYVCSCAVKNIT